MTARISKLRVYFLEYAADASPDTPTAASGEWALFFRPDGVYIKSDAGSITGPLGTGGGGISDGDKGSITVSESGTVWTIDANAVTLAMLATQAAETILANATAGAAVPTALTLAEQTVLGRITGGHVVGLTATQIRTLANVADGANNYVHPNHSGDVTSVGDGAQTIAANAVTLAKLATQAANSILAEITGSVAGPTAVAIAANKFLARSSSGNLAAKDITDAAFSILDDATVGAIMTTLGLTANGQSLVTAANYAEMLTLLFGVAMPENTAIQLDTALSADGKYSGIVEAGTAGAALAFGDLIYLAAADSRWELADADAEATAGPVQLGVCVLAAAADADPTLILRYGKVRADAVFPALTVGAPAYVGVTAGDIQVAKPSGAADIVRIVGHGCTGDELFFAPDAMYVKLS